MRRSNYDQANKLWKFMDEEEEKRYLNTIYDRVQNNPRFYLDNLSKLPTFRSRFISYRPLRSFDSRTLTIFFSHSEQG